MPDTSRELTAQNNQLLARVSGFIIPAIIGGVLSLLFSASGEKEAASNLEHRVGTLETQVNNIRTELANGGPPALSRRVDDLQKQQQEQYKDVSQKLDNIQQLLIRGK